METPAPSHHSRIRPQFSLLNVVMLTTIIALTLTIGMLYREVAALRNEVSQWRSEFGRLTVDDPSKLHAIQIWENKDLSWAWRVFVPQGSQLILSAAVRNIPKLGHPQPVKRMLLTLESGEHVIRFSIRKDPKTEQWESVIELNGITSFGPAGEEWFLKTPPLVTSTSGVATQTKKEDADGILVLHRLRAFPVNANGGAADPGADVLCPGFMLWLERQ